MKVGGNGKDNVIEIEPPTIKRVSDDEVYLADNSGISTLRICGSKRAGVPVEYPCVELAGVGTTHKGVGKCSLHDVLPVAKQENLYTTLINTNEESRNNETTILDLINRINAADPSHLNSFDDEIQLMQALITKSLDSASSSLRNREAISRMIEKLSKVKTSKAQAAEKAKLEITVVNDFLRGIIGAIKLHAQSRTAEAIIKEILIAVIRPMQEKGSITEGTIDV